MLNPVVWIAALGYFVDVYDLLLFSVVRVSSLRDIGVPDADLLKTGITLLNAQMIGMLVGGLIWGVWGDKRGRLSVLFGSIFLYSAANIGNAFVHSLPLYVFFRFLAGVGLAGELGAGITLVSEILPKEKRGYGTTIVATIGVMGAVVASYVGDAFRWRTSYVIGGALGLGLLILRISVQESGMFQELKHKAVSRGNLLLLFSSRARIKRYLACIATGLPIWFVLGVFMTFAPEFARALHVTGAAITGAEAVRYTYFGLIFGDLLSGLLSQFLKSRKKALFTFLVITTLCSTLFLTVMRSSGSFVFYCFLAPLGFGVGYWAVLITSSAEQFGTNLRSTVTTTVPNFVRGAAAPMAALVRVFEPRLGILNSSALVGSVSLVIAFAALANLKESYGRDLNFVENPA